MRQLHDNNKTCFEKQWRSTFFIGTCLRYIASGWCFAGIKNKRHRSMNCIPLRVLTPMNINTPYRTGIGMNLRIGASLTDNPVKINTQIPVTRCSLTPTNWDVSPGALLSLSTLRLSTWPRQSTVAATHQGSPCSKNELKIKSVLDLCLVQGFI